MERGLQFAFVLIIAAPVWWAFVPNYRNVDPDRYLEGILFRRQPKLRFPFYCRKPSLFSTWKIWSILMSSHENLIDLIWYLLTAERLEVSHSGFHVAMA
jgi:hypothetical protein